MNHNFHFSSPFVNMCVCDSFIGTRTEKNNLLNIINEWNNRISSSDINRKWHKERPIPISVNFSIILYNCQCLSTHIADLDILISTYTPQICILTGVGSKIKDLAKQNSYYWLSQTGDNAFRGVAMLIHKSIETKIIKKRNNYLLVEVNVKPKAIIVGAIYVPPDKTFPCDIFEELLNKPFYVFGDYNAKHTDWLCEKNNTCGNQLKNWLLETG